MMQILEFGVSALIVRMDGKSAPFQAVRDLNTRIKVKIGVLIGLFFQINLKFNLNSFEKVP